MNLSARRLVILGREFPAQGFVYFLLLGILSISLGGIYWSTLLPVVGYWGDMAKFDFVGKVLGTPHPSGYPTYVLLNHLFVTLLPWGTLAVRANLFSAACSVAATCLLFAALQQLRLHVWIAFITALTFGLTYSLWSFSLVAEVYTLNILFTAAVLFLLMKWRNSRQNRDLYAACLVYALSFGNHLTTVALLPAFVYMIWATDRSAFTNPRKIAIVIACVLLSFTQYGFIIWRTNDPTTAFLETDTTRFLRFLANPTSNSTFGFSISVLLTQRLPALLGFIWKEYLIWVCLAIWGIFQVRDRKLNIFLALCLLGNLAFAINFEVREPWVYFLPAYLILAIYLGYGIEDLSNRFLKDGRLRAAWLILPALLLLFHYPQVDQSNHRLHAQIVERILQTVDKNVVIVVDEYDYASYFWYYLLGEGYQARNLYAFPIGFAGADGVRAYLQNGQPFFIPPLRKHTPSGLPVYILWTLKDKMIVEGFQLEATENKYVFQVKLHSTP